MPYRAHDDGTVQVTGALTVEEAEGFLECLRGLEAPTVDLARCTHLHAAALQVLLALPGLRVLPPADPTLARWLGALAGPSSDSPTPDLAA